MKIPRRLKEILSKVDDLIVTQDKRDFALTKKNGGQMKVDIGHVSTLTQWSDLEVRILEFSKK